MRAAEASSVERDPQFLRLSSGIREKDDTPRRNGAGQLRLSSSGAGALREGGAESQGVQSNDSSVPKTTPAATDNKDSRGPPREPAISCNSPAHAAGAAWPSL